MRHVAILLLYMIKNVIPSGIIGQKLRHCIESSRVGCRRASCDAIATSSRLVTQCAVQYTWTSASIVKLYTLLLSVWAKEFEEWVHFALSVLLRVQ